MNPQLQQPITNERIRQLPRQIKYLGFIQLRDPRFMGGDPQKYGPL